MARRMKVRKRPIDQRSTAEAFSFPGIDPRQWISFGTVDTEDPVVFDEETGQPLVSVTLKPSEVQVVCRVGMGVAGNGEGEWAPFLPGDEVLVALPEGDERAGVTIIARLANELDKFPMESVAGQDPTTNTFAFKRQRTAFIHEVSGMYMVREAKSEAFFSIDSKGVLTFRDGQKAGFQITPDVFGYQNSDGTAVLQLDLTGKRFSLTIDDVVMTLSSSKASPETSAISVPGTLAMSTNANPAVEHVITTEAVAMLLYQIGLLVAPPLSTAQIATAITAASVAPLDPVISSAIAGAFAAAAQKPPGVPGTGQVKPGIGCAGLLAG